MSIAWAADAPDLRDWPPACARRVAPVALGPAVEWAIRRIRKVSSRGANQRQWMVKLARPTMTELLLPGSPPPPGLSTPGGASGMKPTTSLYVPRHLGSTNVE